MNIRAVSLALLPLASMIAAATCAEPAKDAWKQKIVLYEDFESTEVGQIPKGFTKTGNIAVVDDVAHTGKKSVRIEAAATGPRRITAQGPAIAALGGEHWGRLYFKVQLPNPTPQGGGGFPVIHSTLVAGSGLSPLFKDAIEVRLLDTVLGPNGTYQYLYNVQPRGRPEFGKGGSYTAKYTDEWTLAEWHVDFKTQAYTLLINGVEVSDVSFSKGADQFQGAEIPAVFDSLSFGWDNYQQAGKGFVAWIDDIALGKERIANHGIGPLSKPAKKTSPVP